MDKRKEWSPEKFIRALAVAAALAAAAAGIWLEWPLAEETRTAPLIRFHVIANSDSPADQALKLKVRDSVIEAVYPVLEGAGDVAEARRRVDASSGLIAAAAEKALADNGSGYPVKVVRGNFEFPEKTYRVKGGEGAGPVDLTLPAGEYEAVRVIIGSGRGSNWWCVLFPPLCFVDPVDNTAAGDLGTGQAAPADTAALGYSGGGAGEAPVVEYRLKVVDWYRQVKGAL